MWEDSGGHSRLVSRKQSRHERRQDVSEDFDKNHPEPEAEQRDDEDVEAHWQKPAAAPEAAAIEEGPDVEAHRLIPKHKP